MAIFDWAISGSGSPIIYGGATIGLDSPRIGTRLYAPADRVITYIQPSGSSAYFNMLNNRYKQGGSGTIPWE